MLNLLVAMSQLFFTFALFIFQAGGAPTITSPVSGETLRGIVPVTGSTALDGFLSSDVSFAYANDSTETWFSIQSSSEPVTDGQLAVWDTASLTDGDYTLRLHVYLQDGTFQEATVADLHVRSQAFAATDTPVPTPSVVAVASLSIPTEESTPLPSTPTEVATATMAYFPPTPMLTNPASLAESSVYSFLRSGALFTLIAFAAIGLFLRLRRS